MELKAKVDKDQFIERYIEIWNGSLNLTEKEIEVLKEILKKYLQLIKDGLKEPYLGELVLSPNGMSEIRKILKLSSQGMNNYKEQLKEKNVIKKVGDHFQINPILIPQKSITFKFIVDDE